ncbi:MAG: hypothetical protein AAF843_17095 [Bacteroidota bacterium]
MERTSFKYQAIQFSKSNGDAPGTFHFKEQLDENFDEVVGVEAYETTGSNQNYKIGVEDDISTKHDAVNKNSLLTNANVGQDQKAKPINFDIIEGKKTRVVISFDTALTADIAGEVVFKLAKREVAATSR